MFENLEGFQKIKEEHSKILPTKSFSQEEKYFFCQSLLLHLKEEETILAGSL